MSWNNKVELVGSLGADPELRYTQNGRAVLNFRMATSEKWKEAGGAQKEKTSWHTCVVWGDKATEYAEHLHKGTYVRVEGSLETSTYDDKDGNKRYKTEVIVTHAAPAAFPRNRDTTPAPARNEVPFGGRSDPYAAAGVDEYPPTF